MAKTRASRTAPDATVGFHLDPERSFGYLLREASRSVLRALQERIQPHNVTLGQYFILRELWQEDGLTQRQISARVSIMDPSTAVALDAMEKRGLVVRVRSSEDRRRVNVVLTEHGRTLEPILLRYAAEVNAIGLIGLPESEIERGRQLLRAVRDNLDRSGDLS
jgi:DNA-binding MarR family transcriptional regulator